MKGSCPQCGYMKHNVTSYNNGCRCEICREAKYAIYKRYLKKKFGYVPKKRKKKVISIKEWQDFKLVDLKEEVKRTHEGLPRGINEKASSRKNTHK